jgi:hypothetical protein
VSLSQVGAGETWTGKWEENYYPWWRVDDWILWAFTFYYLLAK